MLCSPGSTNNLNNEPNENEFELFIGSSEKQQQQQHANAFQKLNANFTLEQINDRYWKQNRPIELFYYQLNSSNSTGERPNENE